MTQTNIVFWFLIVVALVFAWLLLNFCFKSVGSWLSGLFNDAKDQIINDKDEEE